MFKTIAHKIVSVTMALTVLFSTLSFTVEKHFCGEFLIDSAIFSEVEKCAQETFELEQEAITKKPCCKDVVDIIEGQDELKNQSFDDLEFQQQLFLQAFAYSYINLFEGLPQHVVPHKNYRPPNLVYDIQVLDEVYLI
ncbi:hypothetical protein [Winogradskyella sp. 3972H.M.0a.05]|uniref:HYC_CC_PP family protein n=1 Tax=Winogradskyella sp. 3972H.M.0a.05 TaxID=2950277 RepID=UPI0033910AD0